MITKFKLFEENKKLEPVGTIVVCISNDGNSFLELGKEYEIEDTIFKDYNTKGYKLKGLDGYFIIDRFISKLEYDAKKYNL